MAATPLLKVAPLRTTCAQQRSSLREFHIVFAPFAPPPTLPTDLELDGVQINDWNAFWKALRKAITTFLFRMVLIGLVVVTLVVTLVFVNDDNDYPWLWCKLPIPLIYIVLIYLSHRTHMRRIQDICRKAEQQMFPTGTTRQYSIRHGRAVFPTDYIGTRIQVVECITFKLITTTTTTPTPISIIGNQSLLLPPLPPPPPAPYFYPLYCPPCMRRFDIPDMPEATAFLPVEQWISFWTQIKATVDKCQRHQRIMLFTLLLTFITGAIVAIFVGMQYYGATESVIFPMLGTGIVFSCICILLSNRLKNHTTTNPSYRHTIEKVCQFANDAYYSDFGYELDCVYTSAAEGGGGGCVFSGQKWICIAIRVVNSQASTKTDNNNTTTNNNRSLDHPNVVLRTGDTPTMQLSSLMEESSI